MSKAPVQRKLVWPMATLACVESYLQTTSSKDEISQYISVSLRDLHSRL